MGAGLMSDIDLDPDLSTEVAELFGPGITHRVAERVSHEAMRLALERTKHQPGLYDIDVSTRYHGIDGTVTLSIRNRRTGQEVASFWEFGAWNTWASRYLPGHHAMRDAANSVGGLA